MGYDPAHHYRVQHHNRDADEHGDHHPAHHHRDVCDVDDRHRSGRFRWALFFPCSPGGACGLRGSSYTVIIPKVTAVTALQPTFFVLALQAQAAKDPAYSGRKYW